MENPFINIIEALSSIKEKNIKFNATPWKEAEVVTSTTNVNVRNDTFVDLHMEVAEKVDALIADMDENNSTNENIKSTLKV